MSSPHSKRGQFWWKARAVTPGTKLLFRKSFLTGSRYSRKQNCEYKWLGILWNDDGINNENANWKCDFAFLQLFLNYFSSHYACKMTPSILKFNWHDSLEITHTNKVELLSSRGQVVHTTATGHFNSRKECELLPNVQKIRKASCKACENTVFQCYLCQFVR